MELLIILSAIATILTFLIDIFKTVNEAKKK